MPSDKQRADELEALLLALGPYTHKLETVALPTLRQECKLLYAEGRVKEAEAVEARVDQAKLEIKANNSILNEIERELYSLRNRRQRDREQ
jgi:hypothetical protein